MVKKEINKMLCSKCNNFLLVNEKDICSSCNKKELKILRSDLLGFSLFVLLEELIYSILYFILGGFIGLGAYTMSINYNSEIESIFIGGVVVCLYFVFISYKGDDLKKARENIKNIQEKITNIKRKI